MDLRLRLLWYCSFIADVLLQFFLPEFSRCLHSNTSSEFIDRLMLPICQPQDFNNWQVDLRPTTAMRLEVGIRRLSTRRLKLVAHRRSETSSAYLKETPVIWRPWWTGDHDKFLIQSFRSRWSSSSCDRQFLLLNNNHRPFDCVQ
jgi:hypothetical protein